ncbi:MAG: glycerol-3-phosphate dehydrogenase/oxidase [Actinomycetes bacterium]
MSPNTSSTVGDQRSRLGPENRRAALLAMQQEVIDLLVVGAGATGCGTALDAASRGLPVALIDKGDIAVGTSSRSSKLVHGGLRYLQQGNVALVREALRERDLLLTTLAPHLVEPLPFMLPLHHRVWERAYIGAGLLAYDVLSGSSALPRHRHVTKTKALSRFPSLRRDSLVGALQYFDAQMDDARLAVAIARTASRSGAHVAPHVRLVGQRGDSRDGVHEVALRDELTGEDFTIRARSVALCVGVWAPEVSALFTGATEAVGVIRSKGVHLRLPREALSGETALIVPTGKSVLFVIPSDTHWLIGTTDTEWTANPDRVEPDRDDVDYLIGQLRRVVKEPISADDVTYTFAGLRPLVRDQSVGGNTAKVTREHRIVRVAPGVLAIVGGKWTTYRVMARDMVDTILSEGGLPPRPCVTQGMPLVGSSIVPVVDARDVAALSPTDRDALDRRYGSRVGEVLGLIAREPDLIRELQDARGFIEAEVVHACLNEGACTLEDVLDRRLQVGLNLDVVTPELVRSVAHLMGRALGWDEASTNQAAADLLASGAERP